MIALILLPLLVLGYIIGSGGWQPSGVVKLLLRLLPIALFPVWVAPSFLGLVSAALLSNAFYALGSNLGSVEENPLSDNLPPVGSYVVSKFGSFYGFVLFIAELFIGAITFWLA